MNLYKLLKTEYDNQVSLLNFTPAYELGDDGLSQIDIDFSKSTILHTLINQNSGKALYIDLWGTWCAPCKAAFPSIRKLRNNIKSDDLIFVFLCGRSMKDVWENTITKENLVGQHYLLGNNQLKRLASQLGVSDLSYPTYILVNREGKVCLYAPKPSQNGTEKLLRGLVENPI